MSRRKWSVVGVFVLAGCAVCCAAWCAESATKEGLDTVSKVTLGAQVVGAIAAMGLLLAAIIQIRSLTLAIKESSRARSADVFLKVLDIVHELRPKWQQLYGLPEDHNEWDEEQRNLADEVGARFQNVSYMCRHKLIDPVYVMDGWAKTIASCWDRLEGSIRDYRESKDEPRDLADGAYLRKDLELFALDCKAYIAREFPVTRTDTTSVAAGGGTEDAANP